MGNSSSSTPREAPTASSNTRDSEYYQQRTIISNNAVIDTKALAASYVPVYAAYLDRLKRVLSTKTYKFTCALKRRNANASNGGSSTSKPDALCIKGRLSVAAIHRVLNELCKHGRLHDDIRIEFYLHLPLNESILRRNGIDTTQDVICEAREDVYVEGWGLRGTKNVHADITLQDLQHDSVEFSSAYDDLVSFFEKRHKKKPKPKPPRMPSVGEECCICLEPLLSAQAGTEGHKEQKQDLCHMKCGHCIHSSCYEKLLQLNPTSSCPICRDRSIYRGSSNR